MVQDRPNCTTGCVDNTSAVMAERGQTVLEVCLQIPHTVSVIYSLLSLGTTLGLQKTDVFGVLAVDSIKTIHLNRKGQL